MKWFLSPRKRSCDGNRLNAAYPEKSSWCSVMMMASMESLTDCRRGSTALLIRACTPWMKQEGNKQWEGLKWSSAGNVNAKQTQRADHMNFTAHYLCLRDTLLPHSNNLWSQVIEYIYSAVKKSLPQLYTRYFSLFYIVIKIRSVYFSPRTNQTRRHMQLPGSEI